MSSCSKDTSPILEAQTRQTILRQNGRSTSGGEQRSVPCSSSVRSTLHTSSSATQPKYSLVSVYSLSISLVIQFCKMRSSIALASVFVGTSTSLAWGPGWPHGGAPSGSPAQQDEKWNLPNFESLVVFGDSYTDDSRLGYFISHNGSAPPVGYANPEVRPIPDVDERLD